MRFFSNLRKIICKLFDQELVFSFYYSGFRNWKNFLNYFAYIAWTAHLLKFILCHSYFKKV